MHPISKLSISLAVVGVVLINCISDSYGAPSENRELTSIANPHIVGGDYVKIEEIPYQISIELLTLHSCGGSIVSDTWVVTAAHCIAFPLSIATPLMRIRAGSTTEIPIFGTGGSVHKIAEVRSHPGFSMEDIDYDVAVIKANQKFAFGDRIQPVPVPDANEESFIDYTGEATASGWGLTSERGWFPSFWLKKVTIPLLNRDECNKRLAEHTEYKATPRMICAGATGAGSPWVGDSGGPLVHKGHLIGIISWALQCNVLPTVFTNVLDPEIRKYIKDNTEV